jgi:hypothetical protein
MDYQCSMIIMSTNRTLSNHFRWKNFVPMSVLPLPWRRAMHRRRYAYSAMKSFFKLLFIFVYTLLYMRYKWHATPNTFFNDFSLYFQDFNWFHGTILLLSLLIFKRIFWHHGSALLDALWLSKVAYKFLAMPLR